MKAITVTRNVRPGLTINSNFFSFYESTELDKEFMVDKSSWGIRSEKRVRDEYGVVVSEDLDQDLLDKLLTTYSVISVAPLSAYLKYTSALMRNVDGVRTGLRRSGSREELSVDEYIKQLGANSPLNNDADTGVYYWNSRVRDTEMVYFIGQPEVMLALWNRYTDNASLALYARTDEGTQHIELTTQVAPLCTRYESLMSLGCLGCDNRHNCVAHLLGGEVSPVQINIKTLKSSLEKLGVDLMPPSDCSAYSGGGHKIDITSMELAKAYARNVKSRERRKSIKLNAAFYKDNCSSCSLNNLCGTARGYDSSGTGAKDFCGGKVDATTSLQVTTQNYREVMRVVLKAMLSVSGKPESLLEPALNLVTDWVDVPCKLTPPASHFISKLAKARKGPKAYKDYYVVPEKLIGLAKLLDLRGSFNEYLCRSWYSHGIGEWLHDSTEHITALLPTPHTSSGWYAILPRSQHLTRPYTTLFEFVDASVLTSVLGIKCTYVSKEYCSPESRLQLATEFIKHYLTPKEPMHYGPFGNSKAWTPEGIAYHWGVQSDCFPRKSPTDNVVSVLKRLQWVDPSLELLVEINKLKDVVLLNG